MTMVITFPKPKARKKASRSGAKKMKPAARKPAKKRAKLGTGKRFAELEAALAARGARDPRALAAWIGRSKYGKARFQKLAAAGRRRRG